MVGRHRGATAAAPGAGAGFPCAAGGERPAQHEGHHDAKPKCAHESRAMIARSRGAGEVSRAAAVSARRPLWEERSVGALTLW
ncbi:Hypothetical protein A7982_03678 [Minicystis rosea]|nr:Hypothetical protein A7982_03678 [Minicystis rosea]